MVMYEYDERKREQRQEGVEEAYETKRCVIYDEFIFISQHSNLCNLILSHLM